MTRSNDFRNLMKPGRIGKMELKNRIIMPAMGTALAEPDGRYSWRQIDYYTERARGGAGLIITETAKVEIDIDVPLAFPMAHAYSDLQVQRMADLAYAVHPYGAKIALQMTAGYGRQGSAADPNNPPVSASAVPVFGAPSVLCRPMEVEEIKAIVEAMGNAAFRAVMAGFDAVEIHGHTGYLLDQFMTAEWNHRTDEYGGDLDGRLRFAIEIVQEIRRRVGPDFPILFRLAAVHNFPNGRTVEESAEIARKLEAAGIDAIHLDAGSYESMDWIFPPTYLGDAPLLDEIAYVKERVGIPVIGVGNMTPEIAEETIGAGKADFIAIGRGLLADPELPDKLRLGKRDEIRPCIRCNEYCIGRVFALRTMSCAVNPQAGNERFYPSVPARTSKRVLVIGGGPGGLEAARVAAERGHQVTLVEKEPVLGGILTAAATPPFKKCLRSMVDWWDAQLKHLGVDVRTGVTATAQLAEIADADAVIVATGGKPILPDIPGIDGENVVEVIDAHLKRKPVGQNVVVAGGGLSGCDAALELAMQGKSVTIVEMLDGLANDMIVISRISLLSKLAEYNVKTLTGHRVKQFLPDGLLAVMEDGKEVKVTADTSVVAFGMRSDLQLAREIEAVHDHVYAIGDCQHPAKVGDAIHAGFQAAYLQ